MPLKKASGNMYEWITNMHSHLGGECPHKCSYCYVDSPRSGRPARYQGELRLIDDEFKVRYGHKNIEFTNGKTIFIEHMNDLFAKDVPDDFIFRVIKHTKEWPDNTYVWQTKNPSRYLATLDEFPGVKKFNFPEKSIFGTTIETNRPIPLDITKAPSTVSRMVAMNQLKGRKFVTIEPVMDFDVDIFAEWIAEINPEFLNLGADSKNHHLPEPTVEKIMALVDKLKTYGIELREKHNLQRLKAK
jgi:DNA repair photolyase